MIRALQVQNQFIYKDPSSSVEVWLKREDQVHPFISGNKYRKLKYNLQQAKKLEKSSVITFGGAFSNHVAAVAYAAKIEGLKSIGIIRGEELAENLQQTLQQNSTLKFVVQNGMHLVFITREEYRKKESELFLKQLHNKFDDFYIVPEGGTNDLAIKGCEEILTQADIENFDYVCCPVGTGGTISGIINSAGMHQQILGFSALKGDFLKTDVARFVKKNNWQIIIDYHFGGYAKVNSVLIDFINNFKQKYAVALDPIYTGKMMFGVSNLIQQKKIKKNARVLAIHTGGLQGIEGINTRLRKKGMQQLIH